MPLRLNRKSKATKIEINVFRATWEKGKEGIVVRALSEKTRKSLRLISSQRVFHFHFSILFLASTFWHTTWQENRFYIRCLPFFAVAAAVTAIECLMCPSGGPKVPIDVAVQLIVSRKTYRKQKKTFFIKLAKKRVSFLSLGKFSLSFVLGSARAVAKNKGWKKLENLWRGKS